MVFNINITQYYQYYSILLIQYYSIFLTLKTLPFRFNVCHYSSILQAISNIHQQINSRGLQEALEMFEVPCLFHKIFMESETFDSNARQLLRPFRNSSVASESLFWFLLNITWATWRCCARSWWSHGPGLRLARARAWANRSVRAGRAGRAGPGRPDPSYGPTGPSYPDGSIF